MGFVGLGTFAEVMQECNPLVFKSKTFFPWFVIIHETQVQ